MSDCINCPTCQGEAEVLENVAVSDQNPCFELKPCPERYCRDGKVPTDEYGNIIRRDPVLFRDPSKAFEAAALAMKEAAEGMKRAAGYGRSKKPSSDS